MMENPFDKFSPHFFHRRRHLREHDVEMMMLIAIIERGCRRMRRSKKEHSREDMHEERRHKLE